MDRDAEAEVVQQHLDLLNPDYKLQSMYINLLKQLKQKKDSAGRMPGGDLNTPTYQRQGKTRGDMGIPGEYKSDGGRVPTADEIASGKIQMNSAENNAEPIQERLSRNAVDKMVNNPSEIQPVMLAYDLMSKGEGLSSEYSGVMFNFLKPILHSLTGSDAVADLTRWMEKHKAVQEPQQQQTQEPEQQPQQQNPQDAMPKDDFVPLGKQYDHPEHGKVMSVNTKTNKIGDDELEVQKDDGTVVVIKKAEVGESVELESLDLAELKKLAGLQEAMSDSYGDVEIAKEESEERVTYSKTKKQGDSSVTISANADSMKELHDVLKLAGIDFEDNGEEAPEQPHDHEPEHEEPEAEAPCGSDEKDDVVVVSPGDASYSTDKEVLVNYLKDKIAKRIS